MKRNRTKAFSLAEMLIVIAILGIMAAIVMPSFQDHSRKAREVAAKDNLRILRTAIEMYAAKHNGIPPGYPGNDPGNAPTAAAFGVQMFGDPKYLMNMPENPFNSKVFITMIDNITALPAAADDTSGWIYKPATKDMRLNATGTDDEGIDYFAY